MGVGQTCAQVLLSLGNLANRGQYLNASNTFTELFNYGTVPVVNENDTVAVEELRIGDNDTLSAQVNNCVPAYLLQGVCVQGVSVVCREPYILCLWAHVFVFCARLQRWCGRTGCSS